VAYANKHGKSLAKVIDSEIGGNLKKALLALGRCSSGRKWQDWCTHGPVIRCVGLVLS